MSNRSPFSTIDFPGLFGGVSQQAPELRMPHQSEDQVNTRSSPILGLMLGRPPTELVRKFTFGSDYTGELQNAFITKMTTTFGTYFLVVSNETTAPVYVFGLDGTKKTVTYVTEGSATPRDYVKAGTRSTKLKLKSTSLLDKTFLCNRDVTAALAANKSTGSTQRCTAGLWVKRDQYEATSSTAGGVFDHTYNVFVEITDPAAPYSTSFTVTHTTTEAGVEAIATALATAITAQLTSLSLTTKFSCAAFGAYVFLQSIGAYNSATIRMTATDTFGNTLMSTINSEVADTINKDTGGFYNNFVAVVQKKESLFPTLPYAFEGTIFKIASESADNIGYYVKYDSSAKVYKECAAPFITTTIDRATLPVEIVATSATTFEVRFFGNGQTVGIRDIGDEDSNPVPSFIGRAINDVFLFRNRLGFLSGDSVVLSNTGDYYDFWATTATDVLDTDPIDIAASINDYTLLQDAVAFESGVQVFDSTDHQFLLHTGGQALTPVTVQFELATRVARDPLVLPVPLSNSILFTENVGNSGFTQVREYVVSAEGITKDAAKLTSHIPKYVPRVTSIHPLTSTEVVLFPLKSSAFIYVMEYMWTVNDSGVRSYAQQAWHKWDFSNAGITIEGVVEYNDTVYILAQKATDILMLRMDMENVKRPSGCPFTLSMDLMQRVASGVYSDIFDETTFTLTLGDLDMTKFIVVCEASGKELPVTASVTGTTLTLAGNWTDLDPIIVGAPQTSYWTMSQQVPKDKDTSARLSDVSIRAVKAIVHFSNTGYLKVLNVNKQRRDRVLYVELGPMITGRSLTSLSSPLELLDVSKRGAPLSVDLRVPMEALTLTLTNNTRHLPCTINSISLLVEITDKRGR